MALTLVLVLIVVACGDSGSTTGDLTWDEYWSATTGDALPDELRSTVRVGVPAIDDTAERVDYDCAELFSMVEDSRDNKEWSDHEWTIDEIGTYLLLVADEYSDGRMTRWFVDCRWAE